MSQLPALPLLSLLLLLLHSWPRSHLYACPAPHQHPRLFHLLLRYPLPLLLLLPPPLLLLLLLLLLPVVRTRSSLVV
jgi:hypothetical protein